MLLLRVQEARGGFPLHRQIADQIAFQVETGELADGARLPSTRTLARELGLSRGPVVLAYEELCQRGLCESRVGHGKRRSLMARWAEFLDRTGVMEGRDTAATASAPIPLRTAA